MSTLPATSRRIHRDLNGVIVEFDGEVGSILLRKPKSKPLQLSVLLDLYTRNRNDNRFLLMQFKAGGIKHTEIGTIFHTISCKYDSPVVSDYIMRFDEHVDNAFWLLGEVERNEASDMNAAATELLGFDNGRYLIGFGVVCDADYSHKQASNIRLTPNPSWYPLPGQVVTQRRSAPPDQRGRHFPEKPAWVRRRLARRTYGRLILRAFGGPKPGSHRSNH